MNGISSRIEELVRQFCRGNNSEFARIIGTSEANIRNYIAGTQPRFEVLRAIAENFDIDCQWLLTGKGKMLANEENYVVANDFRLKTDRCMDTQVVPLYDLEATAGLVSLFLDTHDRIPVDYISIPDLPSCDGAVYVRGDSMYPLLKSGDIVLYKQVTDMQYGIFWGEMYLIAFSVDGEEYVAIKYVQKSDREGYIRLVSYNTHHSPQDIPLDRVRAMALVKASIRYNTMR